jgi:hypothetical protein
MLSITYSLKRKRIKAAKWGTPKIMTKEAHRSLGKRLVED